MSLPEQLNKNQQTLLNTFLNAGIPLTPELELEILKLGSAPRHKDTSDRGPSAVREAEFLLVLTSLDRPIVKKKDEPYEPIVRDCPACKQKFATNYKYEKYCSNECRAAALSARGIEFDWERPHGARFWPTVPSTVIAPSELKRLKHWAEYILASLSAETTSEASGTSAVTPLAPAPNHV